MQEDISLRGYAKHLQSAAAPGPLTREEREREEIKQAENNVAVSVDTKHQTMGGLMFPLTKDADQALFEMRNGRLDYVQLSIDLKAETIRLESQEAPGRTGSRVTPVDVVERTPKDKPRYHVYRFRYSYEGDSKVSTGKIR